MNHPLLHIAGHLGERLDDNDPAWTARRMGTMNASACSHRFKRENGMMTFCEDCGKNLVRQAMKIWTGKTKRKREEDKR